MHLIWPIMEAMEKGPSCKSIKEQGINLLTLLEP